MTEQIEVRGAREHNLRGVDVDFPRNRLSVVTGASGSGKSSLLFDTIFAEGRRRVLETLPAAARSLVGLFRRPAVDSLRGLPPTIALRQAGGRAGRNSTVSTLTDADDTLRLLFARAGTAHCPRCGDVLAAQSATAIVAQILAMPERTKLILHAPLAVHDAGDHIDTIAKAVREGFVRVRVDGQTFEVSEVPPLTASKPHTVEAVVDRLIVKPGIEQRLRESVDLAVETGGGSLTVTTIDAERAESDRLISTRFACGRCDVSYPDIDPRTFSFRSPYGACDVCRGGGLSEDGGSVCKACEGDRIGEMGRAVRLGGVSIAAVRRMRPLELAAWLDTASAEPHTDAAASAVRRCGDDLRRRLGGMEDLGLSYLTGDRRGRTLSGGELQRCRIVAAIAGGQSGVAYVLDEPTAGLHPADTRRLTEAMHRLVDAGATVLAVEHDGAVIDEAAYVVQLGPQGGEAGGEVTFAGPPAERPRTQRAAMSPRTRADRPVLALSGVTLNNLSDVSVRIPVGLLTGVCGVSGSGKSTLIDAVLVPAARGELNAEEANGNEAAAGATGIAGLKLAGIDAVQRVVNVSQSPVGRSGRSCPATVLKVWSPIRTVLSKSKLARLRGFGPSRFSFNDPEGRCVGCEGRGMQRLRTRLLPDATVECPDCRGRRFDAATERVRFKDHSPGEILQLTIREAAELFGNFSRVAEPLRVADEAGLGYLRLGQSAETLSGGEAQRLRLARELAAADARPTLFTLDEPTTGLGDEEIGRLVGILRRLTDAGHTVVAVEHAPSLLSWCDHLIELGPGAGPGGGRVIAVGTPAEVAEHPETVIGPYLS